MKIFSESVERIQKHNARYEAGEETYQMGINKFSDMVRMIIEEQFEFIF